MNKEQKDILKDSAAKILRIVASELEAKPILEAIRPSSIAGTPVNEYLDKISKEESERVGKHPVYTIGSADPRCFVNNDPDKADKSKFTRSYNSFSGIDIKVIFEDENGKEAIGTLQGFGYLKTINNEDKVDLVGDVIFIVFDKQDNWLGKKVNMLAVAANEYGAISVIFDEEIIFDNVRYGVSVDDIVSEEHYTFRGTKEETIEEHNERISKQMDRYTEEKAKEHKEFIKGSSDE